MPISAALNLYRLWRPVLRGPALKDVVKLSQFNQPIRCGSPEEFPRIPNKLPTLGVLRLPRGFPNDTEHRVFSPSRLHLRGLNLNLIQGAGLTPPLIEQGDVQLDPSLVSCLGWGEEESHWLLPLRLLQGQEPGH